MSIWKKVSVALIAVLLIVIAWFIYAMIPALQLLRMLAPS